MNKKLISAAVLVGISGAASAVNVNPDGMGEVLLYPYYTTNDGKTTNIQVVNTTGKAKAVKVRLSEGVNTWEVLDFNLYLSPYDVWTAGISKNADGTPVLYTSDTSCTVPKVTSAAEGGIALKAVNINTHGSATAEPTDVSVADRLTEGHIEIIEMGVVADDVLAKAVTHNQAASPVIPNDCAALSTEWLGDWNTDSAKGMSSPEGGLFGFGSIIDVANGIDRGYDAVAINNFFDTTKMDGISHSRPGNSYPNLNGDAVRNASAYADHATGAIKVGSTNATIVDANGVPTTETFTSTIDALSAALAVTSISNQYYVDANFGGATDWVVSFPTKHYYVNPMTADLTNGQVGGADIKRGAKNDEWDKGDYKAPFSAGFNVAVSFGKNFFDREEKGVITDQLQFSPAESPNTLQMNKEVNILQFGASSVLASKLTTKVTHPFTAGWAKINFAGGGIANAAGKIIPGIPAIGFAVLEAKNSTLNGGRTLANYSSLYNHKYTRTSN